MIKILALGIIALVLVSGLDLLATETVVEISYEENAQKDIDYEAFKVNVKDIDTDGVDNDGDDLIDNENDDRWIKDGAIIDGQLGLPPVKFNTWKELVPTLHDVGFKTLFLFPVMLHEEDMISHEGNYYATLDHYKLHPTLISDGTQETGEKELKDLVDTAHAHDMKVILDINTYFVPSTLLNSEDSWIWENHPDWVLRDINSKPVRHWLKHDGYNYVITDWANPEVIDYFVGVMEYYTLEYNLDGWRIDAPATHYYSEDIPDYLKEAVCEIHYCEQVVEGDHSGYRLWNAVRENLDKVKPGTLMFFEGSRLGLPFIPEGCNISEKCKPKPPCYPPIYDEVAEISYSFDFQRLTRRCILTGEINSNDLVEWFNDETILYDRTRARFYVRDASGNDPEQQELILSPISYPFIVLECTVPGVPFIFLPEFLYFENGEPNFYNPDKQAFLTKVLSIRNNNNALKYGAIENVWKSGDNTYAYLREYENEEIVIAINFLGKEAESILDLSFLDEDTVLYDELNDETFVVNSSSNFQISFPPYGAKILVLKDGVSVEIKKPKEKCLYFADREIISLPRNTIIIGKITVEAEVYSNNEIDKIEFYVDDALKSTDTEAPYEWLWNEFAFGTHEIQVIAYDNEGNTDSDEMDVMIFNLGG